MVIRGQTPKITKNKEDYTMKKIISLILVALLVLAGSALAAGKVGVAMPPRTCSVGTRTAPT